MSEGKAVPIAAELLDNYYKAFSAPNGVLEYASAPLPAPTPATQLLTKREYFAIMAANGLAASFPGAHERIAHEAVLVADALIRKLES